MPLAERNHEIVRGQTADGKWHRGEHHIEVVRDARGRIKLEKHIINEYGTLHEVIKATVETIKF